MKPTTDYAGTIISLCDLTGNFVDPWVKAGYRAVLVDPQHGTTRTDGAVEKIAGTVLDAAKRLGEIVRTERVVFVAGWPVCTDVAVSGARHFEAKRAKNPHFQTHAALLFEQCRMVALLAGCPGFCENPVSVFSSIFGKAGHIFHPHHYTGHCAADNYTKTTCLWPFGEFVMPPQFKDTTLGAPDNRIHFASPGPERANFRSATPMGFAMACFLANAPHLKGVAANDSASQSRAVA